MKVTEVKTERKFVLECNYLELQELCRLFGNISGVDNGPLRGMLFEIENCAGTMDLANPFSKNKSPYTNSPVYHFHE